ncbi:hypothetical protein BG006_008892 [Podila minutissima]|uniref:Mitochondrial cardiolipin hydrolase n=1 Tax=Podila minutissima TaxID=64525 RepID=A0A9P5VQ67_9FUNG|nr:hypothetical protein BG006_008892 [Podila minutissima]
MSGLILNCLLPFVRPSRTVTTFNSAPSIVQDQSTRQGLVGIYENHAKKNGSAPSLQQLFNAARNACAVDHDKDVITWLETLINASGNNAAGHQPGGHVTPPTTPPHNNNSSNNNTTNGSNIFINPIFFPSEQSFQQLVKTLDGAQMSLDICVYTITDDQLAKAIIRAHERGVRVRIISDSEKAGDQGSDVNRLANDHHIPSRCDNSTAFMHHKFAVVDDALVINGSYNWTKGARFDNKENLTLTNSPKAVQGFKGEFERLWNEFA